MKCNMIKNLIKLIFSSETNILYQNIYFKKKTYPKDQYSSHDEWSHYHALE